jgi:hypothetical protein
MLLARYVAWKQIPHLYRSLVYDNSISEKKRPTFSWHILGKHLQQTANRIYTLSVKLQYEIQVQIQRHTQLAPMNFGEQKGPTIQHRHPSYRVFNLKVDRRLSREYFASDAIYNGSAGMTLYHYTCNTWQDCCRRGENWSWPTVSVESVDSECWCLINAIFYAFIMRLTVEERVFFWKVILKRCITPTVNKDSLKNLEGKRQ